MTRWDMTLKRPVPAVYDVLCVGQFLGRTMEHIPELNWKAWLLTSSVSTIPTKGNILQSIWVDHLHFFHRCCKEDLPTLQNLRSQYSVVEMRLHSISLDWGQTLGPQCIADAGQATGFSGEVVEANFICISWFRFGIESIPALSNSTKIISGLLLCQKTRLKISW